MSGRLNRLALAIFSGAALLGAAGCSEDEERGETTARAPKTPGAQAGTMEAKARPPASAREYRREASRICRDAERKAMALDPPSTPDGAVRFIREALAQSKTYLARHDALRPPPQLRRLHEESKEINAEALRRTRGVLERIEAGADAQGALLDFANSLGELASRSNENARRQGLPDCVSNPAPDAGQNRDAT